MTQRNSMRISDQTLRTFIWSWTKIIGQCARSCIYMMPPGRFQTQTYRFPPRTLVHSPLWCVTGFYFPFSKAQWSLFEFVVVRDTMIQSESFLSQAFSTISAAFGGLLLSSVCTAVRNTSPAIFSAICFSYTTKHFHLKGIKHGTQVDPSRLYAI